MSQRITSNAAQLGSGFPLADVTVELNPEPPGPEKDLEYVDSSAHLWTVVSKEGEKYDEILVQSWKGDMDGILIFTGLFSTVVAAFILDGYKYLIRSPNDTTNQLLIQITQQLSASATGSEPPSPFSLPPFHLPTAMFYVNILWFLSFSLSVACALAATLVQQWARKYSLTTQRPSSPQRRARVRTYMFQGVVRFRLDTVVNTVPLLLHASVFLFFAGLVEFLFQIRSSLAYVLLCCVVIYAKVYVLLTLLPFFHRDCPYLTPMSGPLWRILQALQIASLSSFRLACKILMPDGALRLMNLKEYLDKCKGRFWGGLQHDLERRAMDASEELDLFALCWTLNSLREPSELESFIAGIPGFLGSATITSETPQLPPSSSTLYGLLHVVDVPLGLRIGHLLKTRLHSPSSCIDALWHITRWYNIFNFFQWDRAFGKVTLDSLRALKDSRDATTALTARCTAALSARVMLEDLRHNHEQSPPTRLRIMELREILQALIMDTEPDTGALPDKEFIHDSHMLNLAEVLAGVIPLLPSIDETRANVLCDTLDMLCFGLDPHRATPGARTAMVNVWNAYETEFGAWEAVSAPTASPHQPSGRLDHYQSRVQKLVGPIIREITGATSG